MTQLDSGGRRDERRTNAISINAARIAAADPDDCVARIRALGMDMRQNQLSGGRFKVAVEGIQLPGVTVALSAYGPSITSQGGTSKRSYARCLPVAGTGTTILNHRLLQPHEIGVTRPGAEGHLSRAPGLQTMTVLVDAALIDRKADALYGRPLSRLIGADHVLQSAADDVALAAERLARLLSEGLADAASLPPRLRAMEGAAHALESEIFDAVLGVIYAPSRCAAGRRANASSAARATSSNQISTTRQPLPMSAWRWACRSARWMLRSNPASASRRSIS